MIRDQSRDPLRGKSDLNPWVCVVRAPGGRLDRFEGRRLQDVLRYLPRRRLELNVEWDRPERRTPRLRALLTWKRHEQP